MFRPALALIALACPVSAQSLRQAILDYEAGRLEKAGQTLAAIVRDKPDSFEAHFYLGLVYFRGGRLPEARPPLERAVKLSPGNAPAWKTLGLVIADSGDLTGAVPPLTRACRLAPQDQDACYYLARYLHAQGRYDAALEPFEKALAAAPEELLSKVHRAAALNFEALGRPRDAERDFREAVSLNRRNGPPNEDPRIDYGAFLLRQGRAPEALRPLEQAAGELSSSSRASLELGRVLLELGRPEAAAARLERAVGLDSGSWAARLLLGTAYLRLGRAEEGEREMRLGQAGWARQHSDSSIVK
jgi:Tfp pilus assembly protein PilF